MKALLAKLAFHKGVGVCLDEHEIAVSEVASTPLGPVEVARCSVPTGGEALAAALAKALNPPDRRKRRTRPTALTLSASRVFFNTRPIHSNAVATPQELLQKTLYSPSIRVDDYIVELVKSGQGKSLTASVAACRKKYITAVMAALNESQIRPHRVEPGPCGLLRAAIQCRRTPRRAKSALRVLCNRSQGLAILTVSDQPLAWRHIELPAGGETGAIVSVMRTLQGLAGRYGMEGPLNCLIVHGRPDLDEQLTDPRFGKALNVRVSCCKAPELGPEAAAFGAALGCLNQRGPIYDFSASLKPPPSFAQIIPWGEWALEAR